jgi:ferredoxin
MVLLLILQLDTPMYIGRLGDLERLMLEFKKLLGDPVFLGYKRGSTIPVFDEIRSISELPLEISDVQKPGKYEIVEGFRFRHSHSSPKWYLLPPEQVILTISPSYEAIDSGVSEGRRAVLFGVKPCDLKAIAVLDKILLDKHPVYTAKRRSIVGVVVEECMEPGGTCFCASVNSGPIVGSGFDVAYARLDKETLLLKPGSDIGRQVLKSMGLERASSEYIELYRQMVGRAIDSMKRKLPDLERAQRALRGLASSQEFWEEISKKCIGCGNCNYVCPTCFCTEFIDRVEADHTERVATWIGCLTYTYGLVAGGHFRKQLYMRYRHFTLHKFLYYPLQTGGLLGCVGCGRCITWCPVGLDLVENLSRVLGVKNVEA